MTEKKEIRKLHNSLRDGIESGLKKSAEKEIAIKILKKYGKAIEEKGILFVYAPIKSEVNLSDMYNYLKNRGVKLAYPRVYKKEMDFYLCNDESDFFTGSFNVPEPKEYCKKVFPDKDFFIVPGLVFNDLNERIGYGAGYYDRYFSRFPGNIKIGVCFKNQIDNDFKADEHDISMDDVFHDELI